MVDLAATISGRCRGVARDMYLTKDPLTQKKPLTVQQVRKLETAMLGTCNVFKCIVGQLLFCIHACCRWKDSQRLKSISLEIGRGETLLHADAIASKTAVSAEARTRFLPYTAIGTGVSKICWAQAWTEARDAEGLSFEGCVLPSYSERHACWLAVPMSASEATCWLRDFIEGTDQYRPELIGSHSCKTTLLTWAGRCTKVTFTPSERRLLGHHLDPGMKSVLCYSRESFTALYSKVLCMFRAIRSGEYSPDLPAVDRVILMADDSEDHQQPLVEEQFEDEARSDSGSSDASVEICEGPPSAVGDVVDHCISLFPAFPGVPESDLMVHNLSGLVHVVNEDDLMLCGRPTSGNFKIYAQVVDRENLASCRQCLRSFQNRKV